MVSPERRTRADVLVAVAIAAMVWLAVYLRQRWSPESKPVHAPHDETGR